MLQWCGYYTTVKYVFIQDVRLGLLRWILLVGIAIYVVVVEMIQMGGYLDGHSVVGVVRFSLQQPTVDNCNPYEKPQKQNKSSNVCRNNFSPLHTQPYCQQYYNNNNENNTKISVNGSVYPCQIYEAINAQVVRETSLVVWTRATTYNQTLICDGSGNNSTSSQNETCPSTYRSNNNNNNNKHDPDDDYTPEPFYISQAEAFTILVDHAVTASQICEHQSQRRSSSSSALQHYSCSAQAFEHSGRLFVSTNHDLCHEEFQKNNSFASVRGKKPATTAPCYVGANHTTDKGQDFFTLQVLLQAAGMSLDDCSSGEDNNDGNNNNNNNNRNTTAHDSSDNNSPSSLLLCQKSYRETGATILLKIVWNDFVPFGGGVTEPFYYYVPQRISTTYKESIPFYQQYRESRTLMQAHGIKVAVLLTGSFHEFQFVSFLVTLTTALGLLAVATTVVDSLMLYVLPEKERYQQVKYETVLPPRPLSMEEEDARSEQLPEQQQHSGLEAGQGDVDSGDQSLLSGQEGNDAFMEPLLPQHSNDGRREQEA